VVEALAALVPTAAWPSGTVRIKVAADRLVAELVSEGLTERQVHVEADCGLRATTAALIIATWTSELASDVAREPVLSGQGRDVRSQAPVTMPAFPVTPARERELGAGVLLSFSGGIAPGVRIDFVTTRAPKGLGWQVGLALPARRERTAASMTASWTRASASLAINGRLPLRRLVASVDAGLAGAYTLASGHGYAIDQGQEGLTAGLVAGARVALPWRRIGIWTGVQATRWLFAQAIVVDLPANGGAAKTTLPSFDFQWAVGLSYRFP
jgi:hypothetical protein